MRANKRVRGLVNLVGDALKHGSLAVQEVHEKTAARPFDILEAIPPVAVPAKIVRFFHDTTVSGVYGSIRLIGALAVKSAEVVLDVADATGIDPKPAKPRETETAPPK